MENKVGTTVPSPADVEALVAEIEGVADRTRAYTVSLTKDQRQSTTKFRAGGEVVVAKVTELAIKHGVALPGVSVDAIHNDLALAKRLQPLADALRELAQRIDDTILEAESECWWGTTALYTSLARISPTDPQLESSLKDTVDFFAIGRRKKKSPAAEPTR